jgi:hypothetical protein
VNSKTQQLAETLDHIGTALKSFDEHHWAGCLRGDAAQLRSGDLSGITHFLGAFGGMGSLNDISVPYDDPIQKQIGEAYSLAKALARHHGL